MLTHAQLLQLKRWNTPTIYNGWEQITACDASRDGFNREATTDFTPQMGVMVGYAAAGEAAGRSIDEQLQAIAESLKTCGAWVKARFSRQGEFE